MSLAEVPAARLVCPDLDTGSVEYAPDFSARGVRRWLEDERARDLLDFWNETRAQRQFPRLIDIDLLSVPELAGWLAVVNRPSPFTPFQFSQVGARIIELARLDITGQAVSALPDPEYRRMFVENCEAVARTGVPLASRYSRRLSGETFIFERLDLPLTGYSGEVSAVLVGMFAQD